MSVSLVRAACGARHTNLSVRLAKLSLGSASSSTVSSTGPLGGRNTLLAASSLLDLDNHNHSHRSFGTSHPTLLRHHANSSLPSPSSLSRSSSLLLTPSTLTTKPEARSFPSLPLLYDNNSKARTNQQQQVRFFGRGTGGVTRKKKKKQRQTKKQEHAKKMKEKRTAMSQDDDIKQASQAKDEASVAVQHREWVDFQKSIAVEGFETGQALQVIAGHTRNRQMRAQKRARKLLEARILERKEKDRQLSGNEIPTMSYSPEETERLLKLADETLPKRDGKRGTRNLKRQRRRWWLVRKIHKRQKKERIRAHFRHMAWRKDRNARVRHVLEKSPSVQKSDREYQLEAFKRWATQINIDVGQYPAGGEGNRDESEEWEDVDSDKSNVAKQNI